MAKQDTTKKLEKKAERTRLIAPIANQGFTKEQQLGKKPAENKAPRGARR